MADFGIFTVVSGPASALTEPVMSVRGPAEALAAGVAGTLGAAAGCVAGAAVGWSIITGCGSFGLSTGGTTSITPVVGT